MRIGFVSTQFSGTDSISLEAGKWSDVFEAAGHECFWFAGRVDRNPDASMVVPLAHFDHPEIRAINSRVFGKTSRDLETTETIHRLRALLKTRLHLFITRYRLDLLVLANAVTIPMNIPLGLAVTETVAETGIPAIAHHHTFAWEHGRYTPNGVADYLQMAFPPKLPNIEHVVINSAARQELAHRHGLSSVVIPNVMDFANPPQPNHAARSFRSANGFSETDIIILQPTRVLQRKGIEHAIDMVTQLGSSRYKLLVSHEPEDREGHYTRWLKEKARDQGVDLRFVTRPVRSPWDERAEDSSDISLWEIYANSDFVTFPSLNESFGNAFLEAAYFRKPMLVNRYSNFLRDIEPLGFDLVMIDGYVNAHAVRTVSEIIASPERGREIGQHNYRVASRYFSYEVLRDRIETVLKGLFGTSTRLEAETDRLDNVVEFRPSFDHRKAAVH